MNVAPWVGHSYPNPGRVESACRRSQTLLSDAPVGVYGSLPRPACGVRVEPISVTLPAPTSGVDACLRTPGGPSAVLESRRGWSRPRRAT